MILAVEEVFIEELALCQRIPLRSIHATGQQLGVKA